MKRKALLALGFVLLLSLTVVIAWQSNWFKLFESDGTVEQTQTTIQAPKISFGTLLPATDFEKSATAQIYVDEPNGVNITNILLKIKYNIYSKSIDDAKEHLESCFADLYVNITIGSKIMHLIIVEKGDFRDTYPYPYWSYEERVSPSSGVDYPVFEWYGWNDYVHIPNGSHEISITIYGTTGSPTSVLNFAFEIYLELIPV